MSNPLILDSDGGVDDAQALMMLLAAGRAPEAVTSVFGNVDLPQATRNLLAVLTVCDARHVPVHAGAAGPLIGAPITARDIHGDDGLGGAAVPADLPMPASHDAVAFLIGRLRRAAATGARVDMLVIGPMTNLALVLRQAPDAAQGLGRVTVMGGTLNGRGNVTPAAEFNVLADPEAAQIVLTAGLDLTLIPWEPCTQHRLSASSVDALFAGVPDTERSRFARALCDHARGVIKGFTGQDFFRFVDPLAAAVALDPDVVTARITASVDVALAPGVARGMVVVDPSQRLGTPPITLVERADLDRLQALFAASIDGGTP